MLVPPGVLFMNNKKAIEVEKKFILTPVQIEKLVSGATLIKEGSHTDIYYDTPDYSLTQASYWLRSRSGKFELKVPVVAKTNKEVAYHEELESEEVIRKILKLDKNRSLEEDLLENGYISFATITTRRRSYEKNGFKIDIDSVDYGHNVVEIELIVEDESQMEGAIEKIIEFAHSMGLPVTEKWTRGKVAEYIHRFNPDHYKLLVSSGAVKD